jgi:enterochelin esterase-like enzyme
VIRFREVAALALALLCSPVVRAAEPDAPRGSVERIKVHDKGLEGNLSGDPADRDVSVYLPPSYAKGKGRYPVVYLLHGFTDNDDRWFGRVKHFVNVPEAADKAIAAGARELIIVMPNAFTRFQGSMYSESVTIGDWEGFVARELVAEIDKRYRTLASVASRGLAGHSMGGYGTLRIGMKYPQVFSSLYAMSPCCLVPNLAGPASSGPSPAEAIRTTEEIEKASFGTKAQLASAAAWSANPKNPPLFVDLPTRGGEVQPLVLARWAANAPLALVEQYRDNLKRLRALAIDVGDKDGRIAETSRSLDDLLSRYDLAHSFEVYDGDHVNRIGERLETKVLPFFSSRLDFEAKRR